MSALVHLRLAPKVAPCCAAKSQPACSTVPPCTLHLASAALHPANEFLPLQPG